MVKISTKDSIIKIEPPRKLSSLIGLVKTDSPSDDPKSEARKHRSNRLLREAE